MTMQREARELGQRVQHSRTYRVLVRTGLVCYAVVHLLIAYLAVRLATGGGGEASNQGALRALLSKPGGAVVVVVVAAGLFVLVIWQAVEAIWGHGRVAAEQNERKRQLKRAASAGRAVVYAVLGGSALRLALGAGSHSSSDRPEETLTGRLLGVPFGRALVVLVGVAVLAVAVGQIYRGIRRTFTDDLASGAGRPVVVLGVVGYVAKGLALAVVAMLFGVAALHRSAKQAGGLDAALRAVRDQPYGPYLLGVLALGLAAFGLYCFGWARRTKF